MHCIGFSDAATISPSNVEQIAGSDGHTSTLMRHSDVLCCDLGQKLMVCGHC